MELQIESLPDVALAYNTVTAKSFTTDALTIVSTLQLLINSGINPTNEILLT
jgi:hypothetical protein